MVAALIELIDAQEVGNHPRHHQPNHWPIEDEDSKGNYVANHFSDYQCTGRSRRTVANNYDSRCWKTIMKTEIPELHGGLMPEEFLCWVDIMEDILEFKEVTKNKQVL